MFRTAGMPKEMSDLVDETTILIGEAIVALIEGEGETALVDADRAVAMAVADENASHRQVALHCRCDRKRQDPLAILTVTNDPFIVIDGKQLINGIAVRDPECPHRRTA